MANLISPYSAPPKIFFGWSASHTVLGSIPESWRRGNLFLFDGDDCDVHVCADKDHFVFEGQGENYLRKLGIFDVGDDGIGMEQHGHLPKIQRHHLSQFWDCGFYNSLQDDYLFGDQGYF